MTEDDTFEMLRRKPLVDVYNEFRNDGGYGIANLYYHMTKNKWTIRDYLNKFYDDKGPFPQPKDKWVNKFVEKYSKDLKEHYGIDI